MYLHELPDGFAAQRTIANWLHFYDTQRPHSALAGSTPAETYERGLQRQAGPHSPPAPLPVPSEQQDVLNRTLASMIERLEYTLNPPPPVQETSDHLSFVGAF